MKISLRLPLCIAATMTFAGLMTSCSPENEVVPVAAQSSFKTVAVKSNSLPDSDLSTPQPIKKGKPVMGMPQQDLRTYGNVRAFAKQKTQ